jgi:hypothetical protein
MMMKDDTKIDTQHVLLRQNAEEKVRWKVEVSGQVYRSGGLGNTQVRSHTNGQSFL